MRGAAWIAIAWCAACNGGGSSAVGGDGGHAGDDGGGGSGSGSSGSDAAPSGCDPGEVDVGAGCVPIDANDPAQRTAADVCSHWASMHVITDQQPFSSDGMACSPGTLSTGGHTDALVRINGFRWLVGEKATTMTASLDSQQQQCADESSWWDWSDTMHSPHTPPSTAKCYTASGATGAGSSNISWGESPSDAIDQFVEDDGNATTLGHRRWIVNPPLGPVGIGYWEGGGMYGRAECLAVFNAQNGGTAPKFVAVPNPGPVPIEVATWTWSFSSALGGTANATPTVVRASDGMTLAVTKKTLDQGYGQPTVSWVPSGWTPAAGETYRVTMSGLTGGDVVYAVKPVSCP